MNKAIFGKDIQVGDVIISDGRQATVLEKLFADSGGQHFKLDDGHACFLPMNIVGLVHRPTTKTMHELLAAIDAGAERVRQVIQEDDEHQLIEYPTNPEQAVAQLREAIEAYELSKPPAKPEAWWQSRLGPANA